MDFWRVVGILGKRKWLILLSVLVTTGLTIGATRIIGSRWIATITLQSIEDDIKNAGNDEYSRDKASTAKMKAIDYTTVARSPDVLTAAMDKLNLSVPERNAVISQGLQSNIEVEAVTHKSFLLKVVDADAERAGRLADAIAEALVARVKELKNIEGRRLLDTLKKQLAQAEEKLREARAQYDAYCASNDIVGTTNIKLDRAIGRMNSAMQQRDALRERLAAAQAELRARLGEQQNYESLVKKDPTLAIRPMQSVAADPDVEKAVEEFESAPEPPNEQLERLNAQIAMYSARFTANHPEMKAAIAARDALLARISALQEKIEKRKAVNKAVRQAQKDLALRPDSQLSLPTNPLSQATSQLRAEIASLQAQIDLQDRTVAAAQEEAARSRGRDGTLSLLVEELNQRQRERSQLSALTNEARRNVDATKALVIVNKVGPLNPAINLTEGRTKKLIVLAVLCALLGTSGLVIAFDSIDRRLRSVRDAQTALPARVIAAIPQPLGDVTYSALARATQFHPQSLHSESYRFLGHHLLSAQGSKARSLMVVSAKGEQGSTTTLTNLGITLAQAGKKVVLVDANMRTAELHQVFEVPNDHGYVDVLQDPNAESIEQALKDTSVPNLKVMTSGSHPENPWELFRSPSVKQVSDHLLRRADYVLYDTPSALLFTDALNLAPVIDGAFLCVRALEELTGAEKRLVGLLEQANVEVLGSVLTDVPAAVVEGYDNYRHYYGPALQTAIASKNGAAVVEENLAAPVIEIAPDDRKV